MTDTDIRSPISRSTIDASREFLIETLLHLLEHSHPRRTVYKLFSIIADLKTLTVKNDKEEKQWLSDHKDMDWPEAVFDLMGVNLKPNSVWYGGRLVTTRGSKEWRQMFST